MIARAPAASGVGRVFCAVFSSFAHSGAGVSYACARVADGLAAAGIETELHVPWAKAAPARATLRPALPALAGRLLTGAATRRQERRFFDAVTRSRDPRRLAYLWPDASLALVRALHGAGVPIVREMVNCHVATGRRILDAAYMARGLGPGPIGDAHVAYERAVLALADRIVAPGPGVVASLLENGIAEERIVRASYGWERARVPLAEGSASAADGRGPTFLFVGTLCVRKGVDTLLRAWRRAGIAGRLVLLGAPDAWGLRLLAGHRGAGVVHVPFSRSVASWFRAADVLVMPALEDGGPLVAYEALGAGLPLVATAMGGGHALRDGENGLLVPPEDEEALAAAMRRLAGDAALRRRFGAASLAMADAFTWEKVGATRAALLG